jgi:predicted Zn-dependent protease
MTDNGMTAADRERIAGRVLALSNADQTEVLVSVTDSGLMRFTHEASNQNLSAMDSGISVRVIAGGRTGVARTNRLEEASLRDVVERATALAELAPADALQGPLPAGIAPPSPPNAFDSPTARADAAVRADRCHDIFAQAERAGCWSAGFVATSSTGLTVANSSGALASFDGTEASVNVKMSAPDSTGFGEFYSPAIDSVDATRIARFATSKALAGAHPKAVEPGGWTVILEPPAFGELFVYLADHFSAQAYDDGSSFCSDGLDRRYFCEGVTIRDDYAHPLAPGMPFDYEGAPTQRLALVDGGVVRNVVTDSYYARKLDRPNTGHALPAPNSYGPQARNIVVAAGSKSAEQLVAETERGLLVSRLWYVRVVDRKRAIVTGMTRDGTFLIEKGKLGGGVRNLRFNVSIIDALSDCEFSNAQARTGSFNYSLVTPAAKIARFTFTSVTDF